MPYFSLPIPESLIQQSGSHTRFATVRHCNYEICTKAAEQVQAEFNQAMDTEIITNTVAPVPGIGHLHAVAFTIPNCLPERLSVLTRFAEFTILNDDFYDIAKNEDIHKTNDDIQSVLNGAIESSRSIESNMTKSKQFQSSLILDMVNIDADLAMDIMTTYSKGLDLATFAPDTLKTLDDYLPIRMVNSGLDVFQTMSCFGMGIKLSADDKEKLSEFVNTAMFSTTLINDLHSWPKEVKHHIEHPGSEYPFNAVAILMRHGGLSEAEAFLRLREKQAELQERHLALLSALEAAGPIPESHMLYILAAQYAASGSEFWSVHVPRYPSKKDLAQPDVEFVNGEFLYRTGPATTDIDSIPRPILAKGTVATERAGLTNGHTNGSINGSSNGSSNGFSNGITNSHTNGLTNGLANGHANGHARHHTNGNSKEEETLAVKYPEDVKCRSELVLAPYKYLTSMPSKGIRELFIRALNWWLKVPDDKLACIQDVVSYLHQSSLMLDDIEDGSKLRRGQPSTHAVYGIGQTINSANFVFVQAFARMQSLGHGRAEAIDIFIDEVENLHKGQSYDLFWKDQVHCPSVDEYFMMIDNKTGGLFRLCVRLMEFFATGSTRGISSEFFVKRLSRYFQIRDDYQNLMSDQYAKEKGFAEDLDEGKISLPLIYTLQSSPYRDAISRVFKRRDDGGEMGLEMKVFIIREMRNTGALDKTYDLLRSMQSDLMDELKRLEKAFGAPNASLELVLRKLWID
ncbi:polyprenyl synthetase [Colletotrichum graminicola]|uniref:Polyprenyl synthetase n=1 Tax=Colletotrichum graminicola (strain M1.001 / M2 / FGSC 10212) TaxID=645133 RepID=E3Q2L0_COLGM|nr:polyprenyl synthetase [Colletotrichum graminicola M1.001]EFQ25311.1 polyprenyl synthetase [Colletotrichum graminicola M1.001]WDK15022.1 polyprenyl synthetase [Colletotrichum graminicola]